LINSEKHEPAEQSESDGQFDDKRQQLLLVPELTQLLDCLQYRRGLANIADIKFESNFEKLVNAFASLTLPEGSQLNAEESSDESVVNRIIALFRQVSCFGLKMKFTDRNEIIRANYMPTLSGFRFTRSDSIKPDECPCNHSATVEFGEVSPPHMRNIFTSSLQQQL